MEGLQVHAITTPQPNTYTELTPEDADKQLSASPTKLLSQQVSMDVAVFSLQLLAHGTHSKRQPDTSSFFPRHLLVLLWPSQHLQLQTMCSVGLCLKDGDYAQRVPDGP
jgi:hypothetical protein